MPDEDPSSSLACWRRSSVFRHRRLILNLVAAVLYNGYLIWAGIYHANNGLEILWCDGLGFVIICTAIVYTWVGVTFLERYVWI